jgi:hypothetical protein
MTGISVEAWVSAAASVCKIELVEEVEGVPSG